MGSRDQNELNDARQAANTGMELAGKVQNRIRGIPEDSIDMMVTSEKEFQTVKEISYAEYARAIGLNRGEYPDKKVKVFTTTPTKTKSPFERFLEWKNEEN